MSKNFFTLAAVFGVVILYGHTARAQTDPDADASLVTIIGEATDTNANTTVSAVADAKTAVSDANIQADEDKNTEMLNTPTGVGGELFNADGAALTAESAGNTSLFPTVVSPLTPVPTTPGALRLYTQDSADALNPIATKGLLSGALATDANLQAIALQNQETEETTRQATMTTMAAAINAAPDQEHLLAVNAAINEANYGAEAEVAEKVNFATAATVQKEVQEAEEKEQVATGHLLAAGGIALSDGLAAGASQLKMTLPAIQ